MVGFDRQYRQKKNMLLLLLVSIIIITWLWWYIYKKREITQAMVSSALRSKENFSKKVSLKQRQRNDKFYIHLCCAPISNTFVAYVYTLIECERVYACTCASVFMKVIIIIWRHDQAFTLNYYVRMPVSVCICQRASGRVSIKARTKNWT